MRQLLSCLQRAYSLEGIKQAKERQLQEGVRELGSEFLCTECHGSTKVRPAMRIKEDFLEELINKWEPESYIGVSRVEGGRGIANSRNSMRGRAR